MAQVTIQPLPWKQPSPGRVAPITAASLRATDGFSATTAIAVAPELDEGRGSVTGKG